jgi:hypothetical protein
MADPCPVISITSFRPECAKCGGGGQLFLLDGGIVACPDCGRGGWSRRVTFAAEQACTMTGIDALPAPSVDGGE